jgi:3-phenylpropionate/trans-cinnamate dioxygenase ferredoxin component
MRNIIILERTVLVANIDGAFFAIDGMCSDAGGNLSRGKIIDHLVECPRHFARFDLRTGKVVQQSSAEGGRALDLRAYPVTVEEGCLVIEL